MRFRIGEALRNRAMQDGDDYGTTGYGPMYYTIIRMSYGEHTGRYLVSRQRNEGWIEHPYVSRSALFDITGILHESVDIGYFDTLPEAKHAAVTDLVKQDDDAAYALELASDEHQQPVYSAY